MVVNNPIFLVVEPLCSTACLITDYICKGNLEIINLWVGVIPTLIYIILMDPPSGRGTIESRIMSCCPPININNTIKGI